MARYLDPKNDLPFKRIFGEHQDLLKSFLNALMPLDKDQQIVSLEYLPAEQVPENPLKKDSIVDVRCKDNYGRQFIVEMQMLWENSFTNRMVFNASKAYVRQLDKNEKYYLLQPVYALAILNETFDKKTDEFYHHYRIVNDKKTDERIEGLEFVMVELPKFKAETWTDRRMAVLWLRFLQEVGEEMRVVPAELKKNREISRALDMCEEGAFTEAELYAYDRYWDSVRIQKSLIHGGELKGKAEGLAEGEAKGRAESLINVVLNGKRNGFSVEQIAVITGLGEERISEIFRSNGSDGEE
ncbi:MAG: Rpn family recombination-promoting nuclease/putative transposase [Tannerella sp.]|jgi:predicted transposase/invertase (TIGR01784 family)|nr:Rpn family recombination-promoting nuclease/putative transposase [Tannerella sp.]